MGKLLLMSIFFAFAIMVRTPTMAGADIVSGISRPPIIVFEAPPEVEAMPASNVHVVAAVDDLLSSPLCLLSREPPNEGLSH